MLLITKSWRYQCQSGCTIGDTPTPPFSHLKLISFSIILSLKLQATVWVGVLPFQTTEEQIDIELELYLLKAKLQVATKAAISPELQPLDRRQAGIASADLSWIQCESKEKIASRPMKKSSFLSLEEQSSYLSSFHTKAKQTTHHQPWVTSGDFQLMDMNVYLTESAMVFHLAVGWSVALQLPVKIEEWST